MTRRLQRLPLSLTLMLSLTLLRWDGLRGEMPG